MFLDAEIAKAVVEAKCEDTSNEDWARHYKHLANGRPVGWSTSSSVKNYSVLKSIELTWTEMSQTVFFNTHIPKSVLWILFPIAGCNPVAIIKWGGWQVVRFYQDPPSF